MRVRQKMSPVLAKALLRPQNLLILVSLPLGWSLCAAHTVSVWAMVPGALFLYFLGVLLDIGDPTHRIAALRQAEEAEIPDELTGAFRVEAAPAVRVRDRVRRYLEQADQTTRQMLEPLMPQFDALVRGIGGLATKAQQIDRYLSQESIQELQAQIAQSEQRLGSASDAEIREHLQASCAAIRERLDAHRDLQVALERIRSQIESAVDSMEAMHARVVRIGVADAARAKEERQPVTDRISALLEAIEETDRHVSRIVGTQKSS